MLVAVSFVIAVGFGIVAPALPTFARSFNVSVTAASIVISAFAFMRLSFAPVSGRLVSALGERPVYIGGITVVGLSTGACAFAADYWQLLVLRSLGGIGSTMFTNGWAVYGVRVSLVPLFVVEVLHRPGSLAGVALSVFAAGTVTVLTFSGRLVDVVGRRLPMLVGLAITGGATMWLGFTRGVPEFLAAALIAGAGTGLITPAQGATVADVIGSQARGGPVLAVVQMTADIGSIFGPIATGLLVDHLSYPAAFILTGGVALLAAVVWLRSPETLPRKDVQPAPIPISAPIR